MKSSYQRSQFHIQVHTLTNVFDQKTLFLLHETYTIKHTTPNLNTRYLHGELGKEAV